MTSDDLPAPTRRYTDEEVRKLFERAAELESQGALTPSPVDGPTVADLERIAEEAGMDPAAVRRAAEEMEGRRHRAGQPAPARSPSLLGAPLTRSITRIVEGEVSPEALESMIAPIEHAAAGAEPGSTTVLGRSLTWRSGSSNDKPELMVSAVVDQGETRIRIEERYQKVAGVLYGGIMGGVGCGVGFGVGMGVGLGALESALFAVLFPVAWLGGTYAVARSALRSKVEDRARILEELAGDLARIADRARADESSR